MYFQNSHYRIAALVVLLTFRSLDVSAEYTYGPVSISAFGTLGGAWLSNSHVDYGLNIQPVGPGKTHDFDLGLDSRLGAQLNISLTPSTLITAQAVVERLPNNEFGPRLTQANIRQEITDDFAVRIGRMQSPVFLASEYRLANFSNPWVRTPHVVYGIYPLTHIDSADLSYRMETGVGTFSLNAGYGWLTYPIPLASQNSDTADLNIDDVIYANLKLDNGPWRVKLSWLHGHVTSHTEEIDKLIAFYQQFDPAAAQALRPDYLGVGIYTAGISYESESWLLMTEWGIGLMDHATIIGTAHGGYLTVGYRFGRWMPHITLGYHAITDRRVHSPIPFIDLSLASLHQAQRSNYRTLAAGLNYTVTDSVILRGQVDLIDPTKNSHGPYIGADQNYSFRNPGVDALFSLTLDFVY
ncbi:MAG: hypothetical protein ACU836_00420 [Gammaproteobacteria bacterium]